MIFDVHRYKCRYRTAPDQLKLYEEMGHAAHLRHFGEPVVFGMGETGDMDSYTHVWAFKDAADRERRRAALIEDPEMQAFIQAGQEAGYVLSRESYIVKAAPFCKTGT